MSASEDPVFLGNKTGLIDVGQTYGDLVEKEGKLRIRCVSN